MPLPTGEDLRDPRLEIGPYPKIYRLTMPAIFFILAFGVAITVCGILAFRFSLHQLLAQEDANPASPLRLFVVSIPFTGLGLWFAGTALVYQLVIRRDSVEENDIFRRKRFFLCEIAGKNVYKTLPVRSVVIYPVDREIIPMKIEMLFKNTEALDEWIGLIPDLEASPEEWREHLKYQRIVHISLLIVSMGIPVCYLLLKLVRKHLEV